MVLILMNKDAEGRSLLRADSNAGEEMVELLS